MDDEMTMPEDLSFLSEDVKRQQQIAQHALEEAKKLDSVLKDQNIPDILKPPLREAKESFLRVARELAANAILTSTSAITAICFWS
jgi:hypothetical protein